MLGFEGENAREKVIVLFTMCFALAMAMLDNTVVNVALPTLREKLGADISELQWIVDGYVLAFASLLLTGGILGDRYGRKRMFLSGLAVFTLASLACGLSASAHQLMGFRALQGVGAALLIPGTLAILTVTFPPHERAKAIGLWAGISGLSLALGPTLGGWMIENWGWQSIFFLNVPIGITALLVASRTVTESRSDHARALDVPGLALGTAALFALTYGLIEANTAGWTDPLIVASLVGGGLLVAGFIAWEAHSPKAMMPLSLFRIPAFAAGNTVASAVSFGMFATFFFLSLYMQTILGYSPMETGVRFLPMTIMIVITAPNAGRYASRHGSRIPMTYGLILAGTGLLLLSRSGLDTPYWLLAPVFMMMGHGMGSTMAPMTAAVMNAVGPERAGLGSATTNTSREVGGVFGIALLGTILFTHMSSALPAALESIGLTPVQAETIGRAASHGRFDPDGLAALGIAPQQLPGIFDAYKTAFLGGFRLSLTVGAAVLLLAAIVANRFIPGGAPAQVEVGAPREAAPVALGEA